MMRANGQLFLIPDGMNKPITQKWHALVGSLLTLPSLLGMNKQAKMIYAGEALSYRYC
jgi:hypothetical protein